MNDKSAQAFRTISEVAEDLDLPQHVLRFWETRFPQIKPLKRGGGRRYYRPDDIDLLKGIQHLLYVKGYTIKGVQKILKEQGNRFVTAIGAGDTAGLDDIPVPAEGHVQPAGGYDEAGEKLPERPRSGLSNLLRRDRDMSGTASALPPESVARLNQVLMELLELKRLLDQVR
ncbi:MerR family transcriptional regulator [Aureimonas fodinaquatilis]|uniref:MerR family transcriptional regulator n=1 Tax=Aureimonas fodinaquatilis TaxID=2565783 RepID=A0A5B0DXC9_9HYPH|nr:MerR family transcriptional regulator [Aureimonas fodinaquatilis]KAA0970652.1 MerR family transcriptional regulator [Aureimonas fodinaquatilis]